MILWYKAEFSYFSGQNSVQNVSRIHSTIFRYSSFICFSDQKSEDQILWKDHKIWKKIQYFDATVSSVKNLWPSQNIWTLKKNCLQLFLYFSISAKKAVGQWIFQEYGQISEQKVAKVT